LWGVRGSGVGPRALHGPAGVKNVWNASESPMSARAERRVSMATSPAGDPAGIVPQRAAVHDNRN